jgi:transposase
VRRTLIQAGRRRNLQVRVVAVHDGLAAPQLAAPALVQAAYGDVVGALVAVLGCLNQQIAELEQQLAARFAAHPDGIIVRSLPGLGVVLGARVLAEFGDDPDRYQTARAARRSQAPPQSPDPRDCAPRWSPAQPATSGWWTPATCGHSPR